MGNIINNILALAGLLILAGLGYYLFILDGSSQLSGGSFSTNEAEFANQQFLRQIQELNENELQSTIFSDERFVSLVDFELPLVETEVGRENPFEPTD